MENQTVKVVLIVLALIAILTAFSAFPSKIIVSSTATSSQSQAAREKYAQTGDYLDSFDDDAPPPSPSTGKLNLPPKDEAENDDNDSEKKNKKKKNTKDDDDKQSSKNAHDDAASKKKKDGDDHVGGVDEGQPADVETKSWFGTQDEKETNLTHRVIHLPIAIALRQHRLTRFDGVKDKNKMVGCALVVLQTRNCKAWKESLADCVYRLGRTNFEQILGDRCIRSPFWTTLLPKFMAESGKYDDMKTTKQYSPDGWKEMSRGTVWDGQVRKSDFKTRYIPPEERIIAPFPGPRKCSDGCVNYPIAFAIPEEYYVDKVPRTKVFDWNPLMPKFTPAQGAYEASIEDEDLFREMYSQSYFAWTHSRAGWDCMRHYDILSAGGVPFFYDITGSPRNTMAHLPKELLKRATNMAGVDHILQNGRSYTQHNMFGGVNFHRHGDIHANKFNITEYYQIADELLTYSRKYLTTTAVAAYFLKSVDKEKAKAVYFVSRGSYDYLEATLTHGLASLGVKVYFISQQTRDYLYRMKSPDGKIKRSSRDNMLRPFYPSTYGAGFGFACRFPFDDKFVFVNPGDVAREIFPKFQNKEIDLAIWNTKENNNMIGILEVKQAGIKIAMLDGQDKHDDLEHFARKACQHGTLFTREMSDKTSC